MLGELFGIAAFRSKQQASAFDTAMRKQGISCKLINTPFEIGMECGLSVKFPIASLQTAISINERQPFSALIGFFSAEKVNGNIETKPVQYK